MNVYKGCAVLKNINVTSLYSAFEADFTDGYSSVGEAHDFWELVFVKSGSVGVLAGDRILELSENMLILHPPMEFHRIWANENDPARVIFISFACNWTFPPKNNIIQLDSDSAKLTAYAKNSITEAFDMNGRAVVNPKKTDIYASQRAVSVLEELLMRLCSNSGMGVQERVEPSTGKYAEIVKILEDNKHLNLTLAEIADKCNMSVSNLKKVFFKYAGMGIKHYYNELKAHQAVQYLNDGMSVKETAAMLGFADQNYFSYFFKRIMGSSPTDYAKQNKPQ